MLQPWQISTTSSLSGALLRPSVAAMPARTSDLYLGYGQWHIQPTPKPGVPYQSCIMGRSRSPITDFDRRVPVPTETPRGEGEFRIIMGRSHSDGRYSPPKGDGGRGRKRRADNRELEIKEEFRKATTKALLRTGLPFVSQETVEAILFSGDSHVTAAEVSTLFLSKKYFDHL